jgi:purine-binding chemotaxis protein CheW
MRHIVFRLDKERFALPLSAIREVLVPPWQWTRVPRAPSAVRGVINLRGRVVTVVELRRLFDIAGSASAAEKIVLLDRGRRDLGLLVSDVDGIESIEKIAHAPGKAERAVRGVARLRGQAVTVLDPEGVDGAVVAAFDR